jgi:magnesium and cobalt transporter
MFFVPESIDVNALLRDMQTNKKSIAVVVDSFGGTAGIVTIEDILEEIVGDIDDEYDVEESSEIVKIGENTWIVNALIKVVDLNEELEINLPEGEYETLAGLVIHHLARIPSKGQKITIDQYKLEIIETTHRKINKVKIIAYSD